MFPVGASSRHVVATPPVLVIVSRSPTLNPGGTPVKTNSPAPPGEEVRPSAKAQIGDSCAWACDVWPRLAARAAAPPRRVETARRFRWPQARARKPPARTRARHLLTIVVTPDGGIFLPPFFFGLSSNSRMADVDRRRSPVILLSVLSAHNRNNCKFDQGKFLDMLNRNKGFQRDHHPVAEAYLKLFFAGVETAVKRCCACFLTTEGIFIAISCQQGAGKIRRYGQARRMPGIRTLK